ncbi:SIR2 family protein [Mesorhizobium sp. M0999]|uniref:P-loop NTPase n=1 Tax=unclassified Mesorhizobium TaxID=325217 RepID=UPI00333ABA1E
MSELPAGLLRELRAGRCVLFIGAGASAGALNDVGDEIPLANALAVELAAKFLGAGYEGADFRSVYDLACSEHDVPTVQRYLFDRLFRFQPAPHHKLIPLLPWAGIMGTNYDLIIERAYAQQTEAVATVVPNIKDGDSPTNNIVLGSIPYIKLHGCITAHAETDPPLVASTEQLINYRKGRVGQFNTFLEWAKTRTLIFCGYSFLDPNLRTLFEEIKKEGDNRPRHYIVNRTVRDAERRYWSDRRVDAIQLTFADFLGQLIDEVPENERRLASRNSTLPDQTTFTPFISSQDRESPELRSYISTLISHVNIHSGKKPKEPKNFYRGFDLDWDGIVGDLDVRQPIVDDILSEEVIAPSRRTPGIVLIKGHAGSGKTIALKRAAFDAATKHEKLCFFVNNRNVIDLQRFEEIFSLTNQTVYLFIDNIAQHRSKIADIIRLANAKTASLKIIASENYNTWNMSCQDLEVFVLNEFEMRYLSELSIIDLIAKLKEYDSLGHLSERSDEERLHDLREVYGRQLLVALLEATHGEKLAQILETEYDDIQPPSARLLYLDICSLHRFGPPVRAGLISRLHDIDFKDFEEELFRPLDHVVTLRNDPKSGDFVYEARHSQIANAVYEAAVRTPEERFDNLARIVAKLNPAFSYDVEVLARLIRAETIRSAVPDENRARQIFDIATSNVGETALVLHQRGVYELQIGNNLGRLATAQGYLDKALELEPYNKSIKHSLAELDLKRSRIATDALERVSWRQSAERRAMALVKGNSPYPHHTLLKAAIDGVKDALSAAEASPTEVAVRQLSDSIARAEQALIEGLRAFPNEGILLAEEGQLSDTLSQASRADRAFEKAFRANPRSTLVALRLSRLKRSKHDYSAAKETLRETLGYNPSSQQLHFDLAITMIEEAPDADQKHSEDILYHLRRSFSPGDRNLNAQFWYARQLSIAGRTDEAAKMYEVLNNARTPFNEKSTVRGILRDGTGNPVACVGTVTAVKGTFGFIRARDPAIDVFFLLKDVKGGGSSGIYGGVAVKFHLGFSLRGPVAQEIDLA